MLDITFKLCIFGDGGVGKSSLVKRYLTGLFSNDTKLTIGVDFHSKKLTIEDMKISLQIWDFGGEERFRHLIPSYVQGSNGALVMYDMTRFSSLINLNDWFYVLKDSPYLKANKRIPILLVGGKLDLEEKRAVSKEEAKSIVKTYDLINNIECSSKSGENIEEIFSQITKKMLKENKFMK